VEDVNTKTAQKHLKRAKKLGLIRIEVRRAIKTCESTEIPGTTAEKGLNLNFAEQAMKGRAVSHATTQETCIQI
jgi:hypothetical protein